MENFKQASKEKLRIQTNKGLLSTEQLWDLNTDDLDTLAVSLDEEVEKAGKKSFLAKKSVKDKTAKLKFDVVLEILNTKLEEEAKFAQDAENKRHNKEIDTLIAEKQGESLKKKSVKQLEAMRR